MKPCVCFSDNLFRKINFYLLMEHQCESLCLLSDSPFKSKFLFINGVSLRDLVFASVIVLLKNLIFIYKERIIVSPCVFFSDNPFLKINFIYLGSFTVRPCVCFSESPFEKSLFSFM